MRLFDIIKSNDRGVGDTIKRVIAKAGVRPCGECQKRQELLNRVLPYKKELK